MRSPPGKKRTALPGANKVWYKLADGRWERIWYAWRGAGAPQIARFQGGSKEEVEAFENSEDGARALAEGLVASSKRGPDTSSVAGILDAWEASDAFRLRSESTKKIERRISADIKKSRMGKLPTRALKAAGAKSAIEKWRSEVAAKNGPRAADQRVEILSKAFNWAIGERILTINPAHGIKDLSYADRSAIIWLPHDLTEFEKTARASAAKMRKANTPEPEKPPAVVLALLLACTTGLRREDLLNLAWRDIGEHAITVRPQKALRRAKTARKKPPPPAIIPRTPELNAILQMLDPDDEERQPWVLQSSRGKKWALEGFSSAFLKIRNACSGKKGIIDPESGEQKTLHDARGTFVTVMRSNGYTNDEVAEMLGWSTEDVARIAKRYADADRIALAWLERLKVRTAGS